MNSYPYFIIFFITGRFLLLSSFLTIILKNYDEAKIEAEKNYKGEENSKKGRKVYPLKKTIFGVSNQMTEDESDEGNPRPKLIRGGSRIL
jgi:hypothetical protein